MHGGGSGPADLPTLLFLEVLGLGFIHVAVFGRMSVRPKLPKPLDFLVGKILFGAMGLYCVTQAWSELGARETGPQLRAALLVVYALVASTLELRRWRKWRGQETWPLAEAKVESTDVKPVQTRSSQHFLVELAYSYAVQGEFYSGYWQRSFEQEEEAWKLVYELRRVPIQVRYRPQEPGTSSFDDKGILMGGRAFDERQ